MNAREATGVGAATAAGPGAGVVVPVRAFALGNARLATGLSPEGRAELARRMAERVLAAAGGRPTVVVSDADDVRSWAEARSLAVVADPGSLDAAAAAGVAWCRAQGLVRAVVVHADLPRARTLDALTRDAGQPVAALVPCHRDDGTPVLSVPLDRDFRFAYGPGSFRRHASEAHRLGLGLRVVRDPDLAFDVDVPEDLAALGESNPFP